MGSYRVNRTTSRATSRMQMDSGVDAARDSFVPDLSKGMIAVRRHTENDGQKKRGTIETFSFLEGSRGHCLLPSLTKDM